MTKHNKRWRVAQALEWRWWQRYLAGKNKQQYHQWKKAYWQQLLQLADVDVSIAQQVADVGCGPAGVFMVLPENEVTAIDPLLQRYRRLPHFNETDFPWVKFVNSSLENFSSSQKFDLVFCMNAINHVQDLQLCYRQLYKMLAAGGTLVMTIDAHNHSLLKNLFRAVPGDVLHPHQHSLEEYIGFLESLGFELLKVEKLKREFIFDHWLLVAKKEIV